MFGVVDLKSSNKSNDEGLTFAHVVEFLMDHCDMEEIELMAVAAGKIWFRRNTVIHGGEFTHPNQVFHDACNFIDEFRRANAKELDVRSPAYEEPPTLW